MAPQPSQRVLREDSATTSRAASRGRRPENRSVDEQRAQGSWLWLWLWLHRAVS
jgi:hypothetical protein